MSGEDYTETLIAYHTTFKNSPAGQRVYRDLVLTLDRLSYAEGCDALALAFREGRRSVLLDIRAAMEAGAKLVDNLGAEQTQADLGEDT